MFHSSRGRPKHGARQRGIAPILLAGALAALGGGGTVYWQSSGWRVEQTADKKVCGIEKDLWQRSGLGLNRTDSERQACEALANQPRSTCPVIAQSAVDRCSPILGKASLGRPAFFVPLAKAPAVRDTGVFALGMAKGASLARSLGRGAHVLMSPGGQSELTDAAIYSLEQQDEPGVPSERCIGVAIGGSGTILTARHCLRNDAQTTVATNCLENMGSEPDPAHHLVCDRVIPDCEASIPSSCPKKDVLDMARCHLGAGASLPNCFRQAFETADWTEPSGLARVWVAGDSGEARIAPADLINGIWPSATGGKALVLAKSSSLFEPGDSGGPVFNQKDRKGQRVIGINRCRSYTACIMPLYLWKAELSPSE